MTTDPPESGFRPPLQARSRRTMERVLDVTESLLEQRPFERVSVQQIVRGARTSIGAFYARFPDKQALLPLLYERYESILEQHLERLEARIREADQDLGEVLRLLTLHFVGLFRARRNLLRALALHVRSHPGKVGAAARQRRRTQHRFLVEALLRHRDSIRHPRPEQAAEQALFFVVSICRDRILFAESPHAESTPLSDRDLVEELTRMAHAYLCCPLPGRIP
jgi:AcrR family transcriptional regulator